jgi:hypothetical protein
MGNTEDAYCVGRNGGQCPKYATPEALQIECDGYFDYIKGSYTDHSKYDPESMEFKVHREWHRYPENPTVTGLCLYLGFADRSDLAYQAKRSPEFYHVMKRAKMRVENSYESRLHGDKNAGSMFALKNMGWSDKVETINTNVNHNSTPLTPDEIQATKDRLNNEL